MLFLILVNGNNPDLARTTNQISPYRDSWALWRCTLCSDWAVWSGYHREVWLCTWMDQRWCLNHEFLWQPGSFSWWEKRRVLNIRIDSATSLNKAASVDSPADVLVQLLLQLYEALVSFLREGDVTQYSCYSVWPHRRRLDKHVTLSNISTATITFI